MSDSIDLSRYAKGGLYILRVDEEGHATALVEPRLAPELQAAMLDYISELEEERSKSEA